jgi:putative DNA primase/helicase
MTPFFPTHVTRFKLCGDEDLQQLKPMRWLVKGVLPESGLAAIYGPPSSGKSFLGLDLAIAIARGQRWFGARVNAAPVVYLWLEGASGLRLRAEAWRTQNKQSLPVGLKFVLEPFQLTDPTDVNDLAQTLPERAVVLIDTLNKAASQTDENVSAEMGKVIDAARTLQAHTGGLIILVHHTGKNQSAGLRGHSSLLGALDTAIEVTRENGVRCWSVAKQKDGHDGFKRSFKLTEVELGIDSDGDPISSCCVSEVDADQVFANRPLPQGANQKIVMEALVPLFDAGLTGVADTPADAVSIDIDEAVQAAALKLTCPSDKRLSRAREAISGMVSRGVLGTHGSWLWKRRNR